MRKAVKKKRGDKKKIKDKEMGYWRGWILERKRIWCNLSLKSSKIQQTEE